MARKRSGKKSTSTSTPSTAEGTPVKSPSRAAWKTREQLEYLLSQWSGFISHQNAGSLDRFWPRIYDHWYRMWPINPTPQAIQEHGGRSEAILLLRNKNSTVCIRDPDLHTPPHSCFPEKLHMVSQPRPPKFQGHQGRPMAQSKRQMKTCSRPSLLYLRLGLRIA